MRYLSIDTETTGLNRKKCSAVQVAAVIENTEVAHMFGVDKLPSISITFASPSAGLYWESYAAQMHRDSGLYADIIAPQAPIDFDNYRRANDGRHLSQRVLTATSAEHGWLIFEDWLTEQFGGTKVHVAGKNFGGFDAHFIPDHIMGHFKHRYIDPGSLFMDWRVGPPGLADLIDRPVAHTALEDARDVVAVCRRTYPRGQVEAHHVR